MKFYNSVDRAPALEPGEVVWANVLNPLENTKSRNKPRPAILLRRQGNGWRVMIRSTTGSRRRRATAWRYGRGLRSPTMSGNQSSWRGASAGTRKRGGGCRSIR